MGNPGKIRSIVLTAVGVLLLFGGGSAAATITLNGASQFAENHPFAQTMVKFQELVEEYYEGPEELEFILHLNSELGIEKDYLAQMSQGMFGRLRRGRPVAHVDLLADGAAHGHAAPVSRSRPLEQGPGRRRAAADRRRPRREGGRHADRLCRWRHAQPDRQQAGRDSGGGQGAADPRDGCADPDPDVRGVRHGADRDHLRRDLQCDPDRRDRRGGERSRGHRADEVLRGRSAHREDRARDHRPALVFLRQNVSRPAQGPAGGDSEGRQGSGRLRPRTRIRRRTPRSSPGWRPRACS